MLLPAKGTVFRAAAWGAASSDELLTRSDVSQDAFVSQS